MKDTKMNLNDMTVPELRQLAAELSVSGRSKMKKADLIDAIESAQETAAVLADEDTMTAIAEAEAEEPAGDLTAAIINAEADAECERARRLAEYDAEDEARALLADTKPQRVYTTPAPRKYRDVTFERTEPGHALAEMYTNESGITRSTRAVKNGKVWELVDHRNGILIVVKARTFNKLAKRWAKKVGVWADDIRVINAA